MFLKMNHAAVILSVILLFTGCAKKPEAPLSHSLKFAVETRDAGKVLIIEFNCALKNENDSTAFTDISGTMKIKDDSGALLLSVPFTLDTVLPFDSGEVHQIIELPEKDTAPLLQFYGLTVEKLETGMDAGTRPVEEKNIEISGLKLVKKDIIDLLKGKK